MSVALEVPLGLIAVQIICPEVHAVSFECLLDHEEAGEPVKVLAQAVVRNPSTCKVPFKATDDMVVVWKAQNPLDCRGLLALQAREERTVGKMRWIKYARGRSLSG